MTCKTGKLGGLFAFCGLKTEWACNGDVKLDPESTPRISKKWLQTRKTKAFTQTSPILHVA